jgi:hypothetical protein
MSTRYPIIAITGSSGAPWAAFCSSTRPIISIGPTMSAITAMADYIERRRAQPLFANVRSICNALDRARLRQANRLFSTAKGPVTADALSTLCAEDIRASRVFTMGVPDSAKEQAP